MHPQITEYQLKLNYFLHSVQESKWGTTNFKQVYTIVIFIEYQTPEKDIDIEDPCLGSLSTFSSMPEINHGRKLRMKHRNNF